MVLFSTKAHLLVWFCLEGRDGENQSTQVLIIPHVDPGLGVENCTFFPAPPALWDIKDPGEGLSVTAFTGSYLCDLGLVTGILQYKIRGTVM